MANHLQRTRAEAGRGFFHFTRDIGEHRLEGAHHEGQGHEGQCQGDAQRTVGDLEAQVGSELADRSVRRVQRGEGNACHRGRQGEGQVDHRLDDLAAGEAIAHQHPGQQRADDAVEHGGSEGGAEAQLERRQYAWRADNGDELRPGEFGGLEKQRTQGNQHQQAEVHQGVAQRQPEAGYDGGRSGHGRCLLFERLASRAQPVGWKSPFTSTTAIRAGAMVDR